MTDAHLVLGHLSPELLGVATVLVPPAPGVLCAEGLLAADLRTEFSRTLKQVDLPDHAAARALFAELHAEAETWLTEEHVAPADRLLEEVALMRYAGQSGELAVPWGGSAAAHQALYGFTLDTPIELVTLRLEATGRLPAPVLPHLDPGPAPAPVGQRMAHFAGGSRDTPVYDRSGALLLLRA